MPFCSNCGVELSEEAKLCTHCGTQVQTSVETIPPPPSPPPREELILKNETGARLYLCEKPKYKDLTYFGEQQLGNFILTDKRILFLRKTSIARTLGAAALDLSGLAGVLAGLPAALIVTEMVGGKVASAKIKPEEVERVVREDPESIAISLEDVVEAKAKRAYLVTSYLMIKYNTPRGVKAYSLVFGTAAKSQKELAEAIMMAKRNFAHNPSRSPA